MKKVYKYLAIAAISASCVIILCLLLILTGTATPSIPCFSVDSDNRIYIGTQKDIWVFDNGTLIDTINPHTSRAYMFTINEDGNILLSTSTKKYLMDLDGNILDEQDDLGAHTYNQIQYKRQTYLSSNGDKYQLVNTWGWTSIVKNGTEKVYQISLLSFIVKICLIACGITLFIFPLWALRQKHSSQAKRKRSEDNSNS